MPDKGINRKKPLTKKSFERLLKKAAQPLSKKISASKGTGTEVVHPSGDCSGKCKSQDKIEGNEG